MKITSLRRFARFAYPQITNQTTIQRVPDNRLEWRLPGFETYPERPQHITVRIERFRTATRHGKFREFKWGYSPERDTLLLADWYEYTWTAPVGSRPAWVPPPEPPA